MSLVQPALDVWLRDFSPGLLDSPESDTLPRGALAAGRNCFFAKAQDEMRGRRASLQKRPGSRLLNPSAIAAGARVDGATEFTRPGANPELIVACNGSVYRFNSGTNAFDLLTGGAGIFTAGNAVRFLTYRRQLFMTDGAVMKRYDGTTVHDVGLSAPTSVTALGTDTGPGVTGTYEAVYTWYDGATGHDSSPSSPTATQAFANEQRVHTKPGGAPPANVTHWRAWVRRTDTYEPDYYLAGAFTIASATGTEAVSDTLRRELGPRPNEHDVPPAFAVLGSWKGFVFGAVANDANLHVSKQGNGEAFHPRNVFPVGTQARDVRAISNFGTELLVQTPRRTYYLVGDRLPFKIDELWPEFGSVSQEAGVEVEGRWYAWDEQVGPYVAVLGGQPRALATNRIDLASINRTQLAQIRANVLPRAKLVVWAVPTGTQSRCRMLLAYHYGFDAWLPPITGLEYSVLTRFTPTDGSEAGLYLGDYWGRVYELFTGRRDGPPSGTVQATITDATSSVITAAGASFYTGGSGLAGMPVAVISPAGVIQWRRILSNTATTITLDTTHDVALTTVPEPSVGTWTVLVGGIDWFAVTQVIDGGDPGVMKRGGHLEIQGRPGSATELDLDVRVRLNDSQATARQLTYDYGQSGGALWGSAVWGQSTWGSTRGRLLRRQRLMRSFFAVQVYIGNPYPDAEFALTGVRLTADVLPRRRSRDA